MSIPPDEQNTPFIQCIHAKASLLKIRKTALLILKCITAKIRLGISAQPTYKLYILYFEIV